MATHRPAPVACDPPSGITGTGNIWTADTSGSTAAGSWANELGRHGIIKVSGLIESAALARLRDESRRSPGACRPSLSAGQGVYRTLRRRRDSGTTIARCRATKLQYRASWSGSAATSPCGSRESLLGNPVSVQRDRDALPAQPAPDNDSVRLAPRHVEKRFKMMSSCGGRRERPAHELRARFPQGVSSVRELSSGNGCTSPGILTPAHLPRIETTTRWRGDGDVFIFDSTGRTGQPQGNRRGAGCLHREYSADPSGALGWRKTSSLGAGGLRRDTAEGRGAVRAAARGAEERECVHAQGAHLDRNHSRMWSGGCGDTTPACAILGIRIHRVGRHWAARVRRALCRPGLQPAAACGNAGEVSWDERARRSRDGQAIRAATESPFGINHLLFRTMRKRMPRR